MNRTSFMLGAVTLATSAWAQNPEIATTSQGIAQRDLSIRGSAYNETGISLNGLNLKAPYSAHFNADLPLPTAWLSVPEAQTDLQNASGFLNGTAAYRTVPMDDFYQTYTRMGTEEQYGASISFFDSGVGGFLEGEKAFQVDHEANDFESYFGGAVFQKITDEWQYDFFATHRQKKFGAQGYYGIPQTVYAQERTDDSLLFFSAFHGDLDGSYLRYAAAYRRFDNTYRLPNLLFTHATRSHLGSLAIEGRTLEIQHIALNLRADIEHEGVDGDLGNHHRTRGSLLILPEARFERVTLRAGLNSVFQTEESADCLPQLGIDFFATDNLKLYVSYSETVQQPDLQSLYYSTPYHTGNATLPQQRSRNSELGLHQFLSASLDWKAALFHRSQEHTMDWVKATPASANWQATDLGTLETYGVDASINYMASEDLTFQLYGQWIEKESPSVYAGLYALDYPEQLVGLAGQWQITPELRLFVEQTVRHQNEHPLRNGNNLDAAASLGLQYAPSFANNMVLSFQVENLWDSDFQLIPGLKPRPVTFSTGITVNW